MTLSSLIIGGLFFAVIGGLWVLWSPRRMPESTNGKYDAQAARLFTSARYAALIEYCTRALNQSGRHGAAFYWRALAYQAIGEYANALADANRAIDLLPGDNTIFALRGTLYQQQGKETAAMEDYMRAVRGGVRDIKLFINRSILYHHQGKLNEAADDIKQALLIGAGTAAEQGTLHRYRAEYLARANRIDEALAECEKALEYDSGNAQTYYIRALVHSQAQDYTACIVDCDRALFISNGRDIASYMLRADASIALKMPDDALEDCDRAMEIDRRHQMIYVQRARAYYVKKDYERGIAECTRLIEQNPRYVAGYGLRGDGYASLKRYDEALADYSKAIEIGPLSLMMLQQRASVQLERGDKAAALADYDRALLKFPVSSASIAPLRTNLLLEMGRFDEVMRSHASLQTTESGDIKMHVQRAYVEIQRKNYEDAIEEADQAISLSGGKDSVAWGLRGEAYLKLNNLNEALANFDRSLELNPHQSTYLARSALHFRRKNYAACIADCDRVLAMDDTHLQALACINRASSCMALHDHEQAFADIRRALKIEPNLTAAFSALAYCYLELDDYESAIQAATRANSQAEKRDIRPLIHRGRAYLAQQRFDLALADFNAALERAAPDDILPLLNRGSLSMRLGQYDDAEADYNEAFRRSGEKDDRPLVNLMLVDVRRRAWDRALAHIDRAIALVGEESRRDRLMTRARVLRWQGRADEGLAIINQIIAEVPDYPEVYNGRAWYLADIGQYDDALADSVRAIELDPRVSYHYGTRAQTYFLMGQYEEALADFTKALELRKSNLFALAGLAVTQYAPGQIDTAYDTWRALIGRDARYADAEILVDEWHPAEGFLETARKLVAGLKNKEQA